MHTGEEIVLVKYGSGSCVDDQGARIERLDYYAGQFAEQQRIYKRGVIAVVSGSIALAETFQPVAADEGKLISQQMLAGEGSGAYMETWRQALRRQQLRSLGVVVTHHEIEDKEERGQLLRTLEDTMLAQWVSLINENDSLSDIEIAQLVYGGDNDGLAAHVAQLVKAEHVCLMTEEAGLKDEHDQVVETVTRENAEWAISLAREVSPQGRGGMKTKIEAGLKVAAYGGTAHIAAATTSIQNVIEGKTGTHFPPQ